ncbi:MAG: carbohydrate porin [Cyanobium sp.]
MAADELLWAEPSPTACPNRTSCEGKPPADSSFFSPISRLHIDTTTFIGGTPNLDAATAGGGHRQSAHPSETTFTFDLRLTLDSSFTGKELLRTRLRAGNTPALPFGSSAQIFRLERPSDTNGEVSVDRLYYSVATGNGMHVTAGPLVRNTGMLAFIPSAYSSGVLDFFQLAGASGTYNRAVGSGLGVQFSHRLNNSTPLITVDLNTVAQNGFSDSQTGVLSSSSGINALGQLGVQASNWGAAVAYRFGSEAALIRDPNFSPRAVGRGQQSNSVAFAADWQPIENSWQPSISLGYGVNTTGNGAMPESQSWMLGLQWDQPMSRGHTTGIAIGQAPFTRHSDTQSWLVETFYRAQISDSISVTTALFYASSYRENQFNPTWGGLIQTNLRF